MVVYDSVKVPLGSLRNPTFPSYPMPLDPPFIQEAHDIETNNNKQAQKQLQLVGIRRFVVNEVLKKSPAATCITT